MKKINLTKILVNGLVFSLAISSQSFACADGEIIGVKTGKCIKASGDCGTGCSYTLDEQGNLTISGTGEIGQYAFAWNKDIVNTTISNGITSIKEGAFRATSNMEHISIPNSVTSIPQQLTFYDSGIKELIIPDSVTSLQTYYLAAGANNLEYLQLPAGFKTAVLGAFLPSSNKLTFVMPSGMTKCTGGICSSISHITSSNVYCTGAQIDSGLCNSKANRYEKNGDNYIVYNKDGTIKDILHDFHDFSNTARSGFEEKTFVTNGDGSISLMGDKGVLTKYDAKGNLLKSYTYGPDNTYEVYDSSGKLVGLKKNRIFTPSEAATLIKEGNNNTVTITFK